MIAKKINAFLLILQGLCVAGISLLLVSLFLEAVEGPVAAYRSSIVLTPEVKAGQTFEARIEYEKFRDCGGMVVISFMNDKTGESRTVHTGPLGDRPPGIWSVVRKYTVPADTAPGPHRFQEVLSYQCASGASLIRSPPMPLMVVP